MHAEDFEKAYPELRRRAYAVALDRFGDPTLVDDAMQTATEEVLLRLDRLDGATPSYFTQRVVRRALDAIKASNRKHRGTPIGDAGDLVALEERRAAKASGLKRPKPASDTAGGVSRFPRIPW